MNESGNRKTPMNTVHFCLFWSNWKGFEHSGTSKTQHKSRMDLNSSLFPYADKSRILDHMTWKMQQINQNTITWTQ